MATTEPTPPVTAADVQHQLDQVEHLIRDWRGRLPVEGDPDPALAHEADRLAGIVEAAVVQAACDTRAIVERVTGVSRPGPRVVHA